MKKNPPDRGGFQGTKAQTGQREVYPVSPNPAIPDFKQAERFLTLLDETAEAFTFQCFDDAKERSNPALARWMHGALKDHWAELVELNRRGAGIFVMANEGNGAGRSNNNVTRIRALFADQDTAGRGIPADLPEPHIMVESSPGKVHAYWLCDDIQLAEFSDLQARVAQRCQSDSSVKDLCRVLRLPGFYHRKGEPFEVRIIHESLTRPYPKTTLLEAFPTIKNGAEYAQGELEDTPERTLDDATYRDLRAALDALDPDPYEQWVAVGIALKTAGKQGFMLWAEWSRGSQKYDPAEQRARWATFRPDHTDYRAIFARAQATGWINPKSKRKNNGPAPDGELEIFDHVRASDVTMRPVRWLWPGRFARGKISILAGHPGLGKSQVTASIASIVTTGGWWPVDRTRCEAGDVVVLSAEDDIEDTIVPRLTAAGADLTRIHIIKSVLMSQGKRAVSLDIDIPRLDLLFDQIGGASLLIIDPISSYLGGIDSHKNAEVRVLMMELKDFAEQRAVAVLAITHLNKNDTITSAMSRFVGSIGFIAAARAGYIIARCKADPDRRRIMLPVKNNIGDDAHGFAFGIRAVDLGEDIQTSCVSWEGEYVTGSADELLTPDNDPDESTAIGEAMAFLKSVLGDGPVLATQVQKEAKQAVIAPATLNRAKSRLNVSVYRENNSWFWFYEPTGKKRRPDEKPGQDYQDDQGYQDFRDGNVDHLEVSSDVINQDDQVSRNNNLDHVDNLDHVARTPGGQPTCGQCVFFVPPDGAADCGDCKKKVATPWADKPVPARCNFFTRAK